jgi:hypothetical protein
LITGGRARLPGGASVKLVALSTTYTHRGYSHYRLRSQGMKKKKGAFLRAF